VSGCCWRPSLLILAKGADSLAALAKEALGQDPFSGPVLVFRARRADRIKLVVWDGAGLVMVWKALDEPF
jgi:transposase